VVNNNNYGATAVKRKQENSEEEKDAPSLGDAKQAEKKISTLEAYAQFVKGNLGPGCLALPYAFSHGGVVESTVVFAVVVTIVMYGMLSLLENKRLIRSPPAAAAQTYGDVALEVTGPVGKGVADVLLVMLQCGVLAVQVDFVSTTLQAFIPGISQRMLSAMCLPAFMGLSTILSLKKLAPIVAVALAAMVAAVVVVIFLAVDQISSNGVQTQAMPAWEPINLPVLFGAILYAFEGITLVLPVEAQMARPERCRGALLAAMGTVATIFFLVAMLSYLAFGVIESGSVTVELEKRGGGNVVIVINVLLVLATVLAYPLQLVPISEVLEDYLDARPRHYQPLAQAEGTVADDGAANNATERRLFRVGITIICGALAIVFANNLGLAMAVVGSLAGAGLGLVMPCVMNLTRLANGPKRRPLTLLVNLVVILLGVMGAAIGTSMSVIELMSSS